MEATEDVSYLGDPFADSYEELKSVFEGQEYVQDYIDETEDGDLITVYKPITNSAGKVVAVLGCDYDASDITARLEASLVGVVKIGAVWHCPGSSGSQHHYFNDHERSSESGRQDL